MIPPPGGERERTGALTIAMTMPLPLLSANFVRRHHWRVRHKHNGVQREAARLATLAALSATPREPVTFGGVVAVDLAIAPHPGQVRPDDSAVWEGMKPVIDGICQALGVDDARFGHGELTWDKGDRRGMLTVTLTPQVEEQRAA